VADPAGEGELAAKELPFLLRLHRREEPTAEAVERARQAMNLGPDDLVTRAAWLSACVGGAGTA